MDSTRWLVPRPQGSPAARRGAALIVAVLLAGCSTASTVNTTQANTTTTLSAAQQEAAAVTVWWDGFKPTAAKLIKEDDAIGSAGGADNQTAMRTACKALGVTTAQAAARTPAPDASVSVPLSAAWADYAEAASLCVTALDDQDAAELTSAAAALRAGTKKVGQATSAIDAISP